MRLENLDYFVKVVDCGSISSAAAALFISPQGLSQAIQQLEREISVSLFYREKNRLHLTTAGEKVYQAAIEMLGINSRLLKQLQSGKGSPSGGRNDQLQILASPVANMTFLPRALNLFLRRNPKANVQVTEIQPEEMLRQLHEQPQSLCTLPVFALPWSVFEAAIQDRPVALDFYELARCRVKACVSLKSELASHHVLGIADLKLHPLVIYNDDEKLLHTLFPGAEFPNIRLRTTNLSMCRSIIASTDYGIALTNDVIEQYMKNTSLREIPLACDIELVYGYMLAPEARSIPVVADMVSIMGGMFEK